MFPPFFIAAAILSALRLLRLSCTKCLIFPASSKLKDIVWWLFCPLLSAITLIFLKVIPGKAVIYDPFFLRLNWMFSSESINLILQNGIYGKLLPGNFKSTITTLNCVHFFSVFSSPCATYTFLQTLVISLQINSSLMFSEWSLLVLFSLLSTLIISLVNKLHPFPDFMQKECPVTVFACVSVSLLVSVLLPLAHWPASSAELEM